jgi:carbamoyl-phosphate synthase large subunit
VSIRDRDKDALPEIVKRLSGLGFSVVGTKGSAQFLKEHGLQVDVVNKVREGSPHIVDMLGRGEIVMVINTPEGWQPVMDSKSIRIVANEMRIPTYTTIAAGRAVSEALQMVKDRSYLSVRALQDYLRPPVSESAPRAASAAMR